MQLVLKEGLMYLEFIHKPTNEDLASYPLVHLRSPHKWDPTMLDATNPNHSLGEHASPTGMSEGSQPNIYYKSP